MKKLLICLAATAAVCSAQAQSGDFTGFSAGGNLAMNAAGYSTTDTTGTNDGFGKQSLGIGGFVGYGLSIGSSSIITLGFDYSFSDVKTFEGSSGTSSKLQNLSSLSIAPGTLLTDKTLAYFKLGFENGKAASTIDSTTNSTNIAGTSWGLGTKTMFSKNTFLQIEVKQTNFRATRFENSVNEFSARSTIGSVGVGFMF
jgi:opacity protein-like surface antigen